MDKDEFIWRSARAVGNSQVYSFEEMMEQRIQQPYSRRLAKVIYAKSLARLVGSAFTPQGGSYELLSAGGQQLVCATETYVAKVIFDSLSFRRELAEAETSRHQTDYENVLPDMERHLVETSFETRRLKCGAFAAIALQPRLYAVREFVDINDVVTYRDDVAYIKELTSLFDSLSGLYANTGIQMDLNGSKNIFLQDDNGQPKIKIVDTIVVSPELQAVEEPNRRLTTGRIIAEKMDLIGRTVLANSPISA